VVLVKGQCSAYSLGIESPCLRVSDHADKVQSKLACSAHRSGSPDGQNPNFFGSGIMARLRARQVHREYLHF